MSTPSEAAAGPSPSVNAEAHGEDIEMKDVSHIHDESDIDAEGEPDDGEEEVAGRGDLRLLIQDVSTYLCEVEENGEELAAGFQRIPNRRVLPDYFEVIAKPTAFSTVRGKLLRKQYTAFGEFVADIAQICHNAQVYNRPSAPIFGAAVRLREVFQEKLQELVTKGLITMEDAKLPDLGELPPVEESPLVSDGGEDEDDEDEEDEDEDDSDSSDDDDDSDADVGQRRKGRAQRRASGAGHWDRDDDAHKKSGRPPAVLTPMEGRINNILRGLRKLKASDGSLLVLPFEKLPDKVVVPDYYQTISHPIALDNIKRKAKRKKYHTVDHAMADMELMFGNAMRYNEDDSPVYQAAVELQKQARILATEERAKPDEDFRDEEGRLPLASITYKGETWRVGDWVHIRNPNDLGKPIVAQIYRTWQGRDGQRWINACWYYRPEQTVHRFDKHFFDHEVVKTGQYRDHQIDDVLDRCFVMFITRFGRGRPRGFPADKEVYVCESRYNDERFTFNKIKTWASCVPDEVRDKDYEMDLFEVPWRMRKMPSPIKHLLREDARETDDLPKPAWGSPNAPPIVGAVHKRPRDYNESPPPELAPPHQSAPAMSEVPHDFNRRSSVMSQTGGIGGAAPGMHGTSGFTHAPGHSPSPMPQFHPHMNSHFQPTPPGPGLSANSQTPVPAPQPAQPGPPPMPLQQMQYHQHRFPHQSPSFNPAPGPQLHPPPMHTPTTFNQGFAQGAPSPVPRTPLGPTPSSIGGANMYNPPRPPEVYTLLDAVNEVISPTLRQKFQQDENGRVLFFTAPPLDHKAGGLSQSSAGLGHSAKYLAGRNEWLAEREKKRKEREAAHVEEARKRSSPTPKVRPEGELLASSEAGRLIETCFDMFDNDTLRWHRDTGLDGLRKTQHTEV